MCLILQCLPLQLRFPGLPAFSASPPVLTLILFGIFAVTPRGPPPSARLPAPLARSPAGSLPCAFLSLLYRFQGSVRSTLAVAFLPPLERACLEYQTLFPLSTPFFRFFLKKFEVFGAFRTFIFPVFANVRLYPKYSFLLSFFVHIPSCPFFLLQSRFMTADLLHAVTGTGSIPARLPLW